MTDGATPNRKLMTRKEAAAYISATYFQVTARTLADYACDKVGPAYRVLGGGALYSKADIDAWVNKSVHAGNVSPTQPIEP